MKKLLFILFIITIISVFYACSSTKDFEENMENITSIEGFLHEKSPLENTEGTHILVIEDEQIIPLRSLNINLSRDSYIGNKVEIVGFFNEDNVFEVTGISVLTDLIPISEDEVEEEDEKEIDEDVFEEELQEETDTVSLPDLNMRSFESLIFNFKADYPTNWYYAGRKGTDSNVVHQYDFSDEQVKEGNEILTLQIVSSDIPTGEIMKFPDKELIIVENQNFYTVWTTFNNQTFKLQGDKKYEDFLLIMAKSIRSLEDNEMLDIDSPSVN